MVHRPSSQTLPRIPKVRASLILARIDWIKKNHGDEAVERVLASMVDSQVREIRSAVTPSLWVPFDVFIAFVETIDQVLGRGDMGLVRPLARHSARVNLPTIYRIFYKIGSVEFIMGKAAAVWSAHYDSGSASSHPVKGGLRIRVENLAMPHAVHCQTVLGWAEETAVMTGQRLLGSREVTCRLRGGDVCEFEVLYR
jgi:hypothetical protein